MIESISYRGYEIEIHPDDGHGSHPRHDWDPVGTIVSWDNSKRIDNECDYQPSYEELFEKGEDDPRYNLFHTDEDIWQLRHNYYLFNVKMVAILPLYEKYEGYATTGMDRNQIGFIYMSKDTYKEHFDFSKEWKEKHYKGKTNREIAEHILKGEVESMDQYARNEIYGYYLPKLEESCYGFFGDYEESGLLESAKSEIDYHIKIQKEKHFYKLKDWINNKVNLNYRHGLSFN